jgi:hypothetical protein
VCGVPSGYIALRAAVAPTLRELAQSAFSLLEGMLVTEALAPPVARPLVVSAA